MCYACVFVPYFWLLNILYLLQKCEQREKASHTDEGEKQAGGATWPATTKPTADLHLSRSEEAKKINKTIPWLLRGIKVNIRN